MQESLKNTEISVQEKKQTKVVEESINILNYLSENRNFEELNLCVIPVYLEGENNSQYFDMLVDTGAEYTMVTPYIAKIIGIQSNGDSIKGRGVVGKAQYKKGIIKNIEIRQIISEQEELNRISLKSSVAAIGKLSGKFNEYNIQGILGAEALQKICLTIDYCQKYIQFSQTKKM